MKRLILATLFCGLIAATAIMQGLKSAQAATPPGYYGLQGSWVAPAVYAATNTVVMVSTMGANAGPNEMSGNPTYSAANTAAQNALFYTNILISNADSSADIYCGYTPNVSTTTVAGNRGSGIQGIRLCTSSANPNTPPSCPNTQWFPLLPYQKFYCVSGELGTGVSTATVMAWR